MDDLKTNIMVYLDGSDECLIAMEYAIYLAKTRNSSLFGVYVVNTTALDELIKSRVFLESERKEYEEDMNNDAQKYLNEFSKMASQKGVETTLIQESGTIHLKMKEIVKEHSIDILVVGELAHVRSRHDEFFDEIDRLIRYVPCTIVIAKDERRTNKLYQSI